MTDVIGKGVIEVSADASKLKAGIDDAKRSVKGLGDSAKTASKSASDSIDKYVKRLETQAAVQGKTTREAELYKLTLRGASKEQLGAADSALKLAESYQRGEALGVRLKASFLAIGTAAAAALASVGTGLIAAYVAFDQLVKKAGDFQDMAETTGASAEGLASIAVAAATAGVTMDAVAESTIKLTKNLTGVDDESKSAGAALVALGINVADFKKLDPVGQFDAVGKALGNFADGAGKTAVAVALYGKAGAEQLKVFKAIEEQGGRQKILTEEQIAQADNYADKQAKSRAQLMLHASAIATQMVPTLTVFTETLGEVAKEILNVDSASKKLGKGSSIKDFAQEGALAIARLADVAYRLSQTVLLIGESYGAAAAMASAVAKGDLFGANTIFRAARAAGDAMKFNLGLADRLESKFSKIETSTASLDHGSWFRSKAGIDANSPAKAKPTLNFSGAVKGGAGGKDTAAQEAKAQLAFDLEQIKKASEATTNAFANGERIMEAIRAAGLYDERDYYASKLAFLNLNSAEQERALQAEIARMQQEILLGKDKIDNDRKIIEAQAQLAKVRANAGASIEVLKIQETAALKAVAQSYRDAEDAAKDYLATLRRTQARELTGIGAGTQERDRTSGRAQIEDKYSEQRQALEKGRRDAEMNGSFGVDAQRKYDDELDRIKRYSAAALAEYDAYFAARLGKEQNWANGANEALANYYSEATNTAKQIEEVFGNAFKGMEDALVSFITTGKADFNSLTNNIVSGITKIIVQEQIMAPISASLKAGMASGTGIGGGISSFFSSLFGGPRAIGGPVSAGGLYRVNERGPELLNMAGNQYLMMGNQGGSVSPSSGAGNTVNVTVNQTFAAGTSRATVMQAAADARRQLETAGRNL